MSDDIKKRRHLVVVETHPIQYKAPLFRALARDPRVELLVLYAMLPDAAQQGAGFGVSFAWDVPLLEGYPYEVLTNRAVKPSVTHFAGCDTPGVYDRLKALRPDAVLVNGWVVKTCLQTLWACHRLRIPCLVRGEANLLRPRAGWKHAVHRLLLTRYRGYLYIGSANRDFYRFHGRREGSLFFVPYGVDNEAFARAAEVRAGKRDALREGFGALRDRCVFLFCGKLETKKHPADLLRACSLLDREERERIHVLIAGDGPLRSELEGFAREKGLPVTFTGFLNQSRLPDAYAASDVLVLPSDAGETWGLVVNEAMASGRPSLVSRSAGCCRDLIVEGETGFAFDCGDTVALAGLMRRYLQDPLLARKQGGAASAHVGGYGIPVMVEGVVAALQMVSGGPD